MIVLVRRETADQVVAALLGVGQGEAGVDLQGLAGGVAGRGQGGQPALASGPSRPVSG